MSENIVPFHGSPGVSGLGTPQPADIAQQVAGSGGGPHDPGMEGRVTAAVLARLEPLLARLDERTSHLATKEDVALVRADLALKAGRGTVWGMGATMVGLVIAAAALGAVYIPYLASLLRRASS